MLQIVVALIWFLGTILALPDLFLYHVVQEYEINSEEQVFKNYVCDEVHFGKKKG